MLERFFLWVAYRILKKHMAILPSLMENIMLLVSNGFFTWLFNEGYNLYKEAVYLAIQILLNARGDIYCASKYNLHTGL